MAKVEIYYWDTCPYCTKARELLDSKGVKYTGHDISGDSAARAKMAERTGGPKSLPQIFINENHVGGCDDIHTLHENGELDKLLAQE